jgi:PST family polysaccharide transporter
LSSESQLPDISKVAIRGTAWRYVALFSGKFMVFISTVILARLLTKDDFGLVGYAVTVIAFLEGISDLGVVAAIIYYPDDQKRISTGFWISQVTSLLFFGLIFVFSPAIADYFRDERVINVTRVLALTFPFLALGYTHEAVLLKRLSFKRSFIPSFVKSLAKGLASIGFALAGFGPWSLIWGQLLGSLVSSLSYWVVTPWRPSLELDFKMGYELLKYGAAFIGGELLAIVLMNLDYLLVGRYLGSEKLGVYTLAFRMPDLLILEFARTLSNVLFPIYSQMREQTGDMSRGFFLAVRYISLLTVPMGLGLALVAEPFIITFFTDKWIDAVPVVRGIAIYAMLLSIVHNTTSVYWAEGRPQILTWIGLARLAMLFPALYWAVVSVQSIVMVGWMHALVALLGAILNLYVASHLIGLPLVDIGKALRPALLAGALMFVAVVGVMSITRDILEPWLSLIVYALVGAVTYMISLWFLQRDIMMAVGEKLSVALGRS